MVQNWLDVGDGDWRASLIVSLLFGALFISPFILSIEVRVVVENVDASRMFGLMWSAITGIATLVSCGLAVRSYRTERTDKTEKADTSGPDTEVHIDGVEGDFNLVLGDDGSIREREASTDENTAAEKGTESED